MLNMFLTAGGGSVAGTIGDMVSASAEWVSTYADTIASKPLLMAFCVVPLAGVGITLIKRLMR